MSMRERLSVSCQEALHCEKAIAEERESRRNGDGSWDMPTPLERSSLINPEYKPCGT